MLCLVHVACNFMMAHSSQATAVELTEDDIPGAKLSGPLEINTNHALRWWLLCRGVQAPASTTKAKLIEKLVA